MAEPEDTAAVNQVPPHGPNYVEPDGEANLDQVGGVAELTASGDSSTNRNLLLLGVG